MSIKGQGHSLTLVKGHSDFEVKCLTFGLYIQVSDSGPLGPLVFELLSTLIGKNLLQEQKILLKVHPILKELLSYDTTVIQWTKLCHKNHMTTCVITLWRIHVMSLTTCVSTMCFLIEIVILKDKIPFYKVI